ncbi:hypothetical protein FKM82_023019 [Ascaphus truei]
MCLLAEWRLLHFITICQAECFLQLGYENTMFHSISPKILQGKQHENCDKKPGFRFDSISKCLAPCSVYIQYGHVPQ